jgi:hypothetical protein
MAGPLAWRRVDRDAANLLARFDRHRHGIPASTGRAVVRRRANEFAASIAATSSGNSRPSTPANVTLSTMSK